ncbi:MAG: hypothetical protein OER86_03610 [Phycisphaerae bacterium]|nr:hypothetical protein [Phycisphaerae bacterium]
MSSGMEAESFPTLLWDLLTPPSSPRPARTAPPTRAPAPTGQRQRYAQLVERMKQRHQVRVRKWRDSNCGCAWEVHGQDGSVGRLIESPYPRGPVSCGVFLHEIGHHAIGFHRFSPRCLEEYMAWSWALATMTDEAITITARLQERVDESLRYALAKARRRRLRRVPVLLLPYLERRRPGDPPVLPRLWGELVNSPRPEPAVV